MERKIPLGVSLTWITLICAAVWFIILVWPEIAALCLLVIGLFCAIWRIRIWARTWLYEQAVERDICDFVRGKDKPLIPANPRDESGRFISRKAAMNELLRRDVEAM